MSVDRLLSDARQRLRRVDPPRAEHLMGTGATLVDIRPIHQRVEYGEIPGSIVIERNVLEWRFDPHCQARLPHMRHHDHAVVVVCQQGYTSSLAAASLLDLGLTAATDLIGGYEAWQTHGLPTVRGGTPAGMWVRRGRDARNAVLVPSRRRGRD